MEIWLAHSGPFLHSGGGWGLIALAPLILCVMLVVLAGSRTKDK